MAVATVYAGELELQPATLKVWTEHEHSAIQAMQQRLQDKGCFLRVLQYPDRVARMRAGEIVVWSALDTNPRRIPSGLIHDWIGAAFIPNARIADVISVVRGYHKYKDIYKNGVIDGRLLNRTESEDHYNLLLRNPTFFSKTALDADFDSTYTRLDDTRWYTVTRSTRVQEVEGYGQHDEHKMPPDCGHGYIWRITSLSQMVEKDGGVYVEEEVMALSRDVPTTLRWVAGPIIRREARASTSGSIEKTRTAVTSRPEVITSANPKACNHNSSGTCWR